MNAKKILLAEDDPHDLELALAGMQDYNLANEVIVARDGAEALDYLYVRGKFADRSKGNPLLILLDLKMPRVDGLEVLRQVKSDPNLKTIPVVVLTSSKEERDIVESYNLGVNAYVVKPVIFEKFIDAAKQLSMFWLLLNEAPPGTVGKV